MLKEQYTLYPHQEAAVDLILNNNGRAGLFMTTGSGKTLTSIAGIESLHEKGEANNVLVIPPAALKNNYIKALKKFCKDINIYEKESSRGTAKLISSGTGDLNYIVISQELFRNDPKKYMVYNSEPVDTIVVDELGRAKNFDSKLAQSLISISPLVKNYIGLSATPTANAPAEIVPVMKAILGKEFEVENPAEFNKKYVEQVTVKGPKGKPVVETRLKNLKGLQELFQDSIFYFGKDELQALYPETEEDTVKVPMGEKQYQLYQYVMGTVDPVTKYKLERNMEMSQKEIQHIFTKIQKARALSLSTAGLIKDQAIEDTLAQSPKLNKIIEDVDAHLAEKNDNKVLIYSNMVEGGVRSIADALEYKGIPYGVFAGAGRFPERDRIKDLEDYKAGNIKALVISSAGKEGISLPDTTMVAIADPHFNPTVISQAKARGIRIGGLSHRPKEERKVQVKHYLSTRQPSMLEKLKLSRKKYSIDEWVKAVAERKQKSNAEMLQLFKQLRESEAPRIEPVKAPPKIAPEKERKGIVFRIKRAPEPRTSKRKIRSDKGKKRGRYKNSREAQPVEI